MIYWNFLERERKFSLGTGTGMGIASWEWEGMGPQTATPRLGHCAVVASSAVAATV